MTQIRQGGVEIPAGMKLVPIELTEAIGDAMHDAIYAIDGMVLSIQELHAAYRAALAAYTPTPSPEIAEQPMGEVASHHIRHAPKLMGVTAAPCTAATPKPADPTSVAGERDDAVKRGRMILTRPAHAFPISVDEPNVLRGALMKARHYVERQSWDSYDDREDTLLAVIDAAFSNAPGAVMREALNDIIAERERQIEMGWTPEHDDGHSDGQIARQAGYVLEGWNWDSARREKTWVDPHKWSRRDNLVIAAALIVAEIERLDRAALATNAPDAAMRESES